jgi:hypothetical protein
MVAPTHNHHHVDRARVARSTLRPVLQQRDFPVMPSDVDALPSPALSAGKTRGRPRQRATENQHQRIRRLQDELRQAQAALKVSEERRAAIVGAAALRHVRLNTEFTRQLAVMLRAEVKAKADRAAISDLLADDAAPAIATD